MHDIIFKCFKCGTKFKMNDKWIEAKNIIYKNNRYGNLLDHRYEDGTIEGWYCYECWYKKSDNTVEGYKRYPNFSLVVVAHEL